MAWNVIGIVVLTVAALESRSIALAGFGLDTFIEIGASTVVIWELSDASARRQQRALRLIGTAFILLAVYLLVASTLVLASGHRAGHSALGLAWTAATAVVMFSLAFGKAATGKALNNPVLSSEARVTLIDGILATAVVVGLLLSTLAGWWWSDALVGYIIVFYAVREAMTCLRS